MPKSSRSRKARALRPLLPAVCVVAIPVWAILAANEAPIAFATESAPDVADGSVHIAQAEAADYSVHEWGLVRFLEQAEIATTGYGTPIYPDYFDGPYEEKPVLYFHPGPSFDPETRIDVTVSLTDGTLREVWPTPLAGPQPFSGSSFTWSQVAIESDRPCGGDLAPALADPACISLPSGICEAAEMPGYIGTVSHCISVGEPAVRSPVLLYNGTISNAQPVSVAEERFVAVNSGNEEVVGPLWVISHEQVFRIEELMPGASIVLDETTAIPVATDQVTADIRQSLVVRGLTEAEADQFVAAWSPNVLSEPFPWYVFGLYHTETLDRFVPLTLYPPPTEIVRVLAFTLE